MNIYGLGLWEHTSVSSMGGVAPRAPPLGIQVAHLDGAHKSLHDAAAGESLRSIHDKAASQRRQSTLRSSGHLGAQNSGNMTFLNKGEMKALGPNSSPGRLLG